MLAIRRKIPCAPASLLRYSVFPSLLWMKCPTSYLRPTLSHTQPGHQAPSPHLLSGNLPHLLLHHFSLFIGSFPETYKHVVIFFHPIKLKKNSLGPTSASSYPLFLCPSFREKFLKSILDIFAVCSSPLPMISKVFCNQSFGSFMLIKLF